VTFRLDRKHNQIPTITISSPTGMVVAGNIFSRLLGGDDKGMLGCTLVEVLEADAVCVTWAAVGHAP
jgi:hypothetical protein